MSKHAVTLASAIDNLKTVFNDPNKDELTKEEIFQKANKDPKKDKYWFKSKVAYFRDHQLAEVKMGKNSRNRPLIIGLKLNDRGKIALGRIEGELKEAPHQETVIKPTNGVKENNSLEKILESVTKLSKEHKEANYEVKVGDVIVSVSMRRD